MLRLLVLVVCFWGAFANDVTCRCQEKYKVAGNPTYPSIPECSIPNSNALLNSFIESDPTWNPLHEWPNGDFTLTPAKCPSKSTPCKQELNTNNKQWKCTWITPKCWTDAGRVDNSIYPTGGYKCATDEKAAITGTKCPITCSPGYQKKGGEAVCMNGVWENYPTCTQTGCPQAPTKPANALVMSGSCAAGAKPGAVCSFTCKAGYKPSGKFECKNGKWDVETCIKQAATNCNVKTLKPAKPPKGHWNCGVVKIGGSCPLKCPPGYTVKGTMPKCTAGGKWVVIRHAKNGPHCACKPFQKIQSWVPPACLFAGFSGIDRMDFVIDLSGSMRGGKIPYKNRKVSKLDFLKIALVDALGGLQTYQSFNIIWYSNKAAGWKPGVIAATKTNVRNGQNYVKGLGIKGGTNIWGGLAVAMKDKRVQGVFLMTDGNPSRRFAKWPTIIARATKAANWASKKVQMIFPIAFKAPTKSWRAMQRIAALTGGKAHKIV